MSTRSASSIAVDLVGQLVQLGGGVRPDALEVVRVDLRLELCLRLDQPLIARLAHPAGERRIEERLDGLPYKLGEHVGPERGQGVDLGLKDAHRLRLHRRRRRRSARLERRGWQAILFDLIRGQRHGSDLEREIGVGQVAERLKLAGDADRHLPPGGVAIGQVEHDHVSAVVSADLGHVVDHRVRGLAGRQVQIGLPTLGDRGEHVLERRLLTEEDELVGLGTPEAADLRPGLQSSASGISISTPLEMNGCGSGGVNTRTTGGALRLSTIRSNGM